ncbi:MAG: EAL domain-containing protein [Sulfuricurvum sp.]|uniref:putative bifunctional diguanylate cyclase/phosphodiesterase n=1 Tax=Sulfuricurvum sp. TaxID=2025608 RepID=UPI0026225B69|nr:EAL domain-containing protein [Sulfuricurvum sp.]MDD2829571.1 EAL domain-containing protein [Sulfuricurvum sp.]MDD4950382.1 EAL domain-containing protein [Sulfuricurvum sp.]
MKFKNKRFFRDNFDITHLERDEQEIIELKIQDELLIAAYRQTPIALLAVIVNTVILAIVEWNVIIHQIIIGWITLQILVVLGRYSTYRIFSNTTTRTTPQCKKWFVIGAGISAIVWGSAAAILILTDDIGYQIFLIFVLAGMSAGSIVSLSYVLEAFHSYLLLILIPLLFVLSLQDNPIYQAMLLITIIFWVILIVTAHRFHQNMVQVLKTKILHENTTNALVLTDQYFETIFKEAPAGIFYYNTNLIIVDSNSEMMNILRIDSERMIGLDLTKLPDTSLNEALLAPTIGEKGYYEGPYKTMYNKLDLWITLKTSPMYDTYGALTGGIAIVADISERIRAEEQMKHQAYFDALTDIPNRILLKDRIKQALAHYRRNGNILGILFLDLDHFKSINDSMGHHVGDALLIETALRLSRVCREGDTVARLGGDEFVILLSDLGMEAHIAANNAESVAEKIHDVLSMPFDIGLNEPIVTTSSIGITLVSSGDQSADDLLKFADTAMYQAKKEGRNTTRFYQEQMDQWIKKRLSLENALRSALKNNELELYYQPVIEIGTKKIIGAEALLRWNHPQMGMIMPDEIISIAEESGQIVGIGEWVLREACTQFVQWRTSHVTKSYIERIAVNVSAMQFRQSDFIDRVIHIVAETGIVPSMLELELTESMVIDNIDTVIEKMNRLRRAGISLSMDDFGTGYSSLTYLKRLPFTTLKIDRSFVRDIMSDKDDAALVETILSMASIFNFDVIAEGVETIEQFEFLQRHQCQYFQGFLCSKPMNADAFEVLLDRDIQQCHV